MNAGPAKSDPGQPAATRASESTDHALPRHDAPRPAGGPVCCVECGYDLTGAPAGVCPECNTPANPALWRGRERFARPGAAWWRRRVGIAAGVIAVYAVSAAVFAQQIDAVSGTAIALTLAVGLSVAGGIVPAWLARPLDRRMVFMAWVRALWILHLPWLVISVAAGIAVGAAWIERLGIGPPGLLTLTVVAGLLVWTLGCFIAWVFWCTAYLERLRVLGCGGGLREPVAAVVLSLGVIAGAALIGLLGGALAAEGASMLVLGEEFLGWD